MASYQFILAMLLYMFIITSTISIAAVGMGYGGISTSGFQGAVSQSTELEEPDSGFEIPFISDAVTSLGAGASYVGAMLGVVGSVLIWTLPEAIFPLWANIIFVKVPLVALIASIVEMLLP